MPDSWGKKNGLSREINTILNRTPLTSHTNRCVISDKLPNSYLPDMIKENGEATVYSILESHFISRKAVEILLRDPFTPDDFQEFISERQRTLMDAIENLLIKERFGLPANLREIDEELEEIELALRKVIVEAVNNNSDELPEHLYAGAKERIQKALRKNSAMNAEEYETAVGVLQFFDLRGLEDTICSKSLYNRFSDRFPHKETFKQKFSQLAEIRNSIRHSRSVDEITQKEGEAAILWFKKSLSL